MPDIFGQPRCIVIISSEQTSKSSNYYNDDTITYHEWEDDNSEHTIPVATDVIPLWFLNIVM